MRRAREEQHAECVVAKTIDADDHLIFIGRVLHGRARGGLPLMFFRRTYGEWTEPEKPAGEAK